MEEVRTSSICQYAIQPSQRPLAPTPAVLTSLKQTLSSSSLVKLCDRISSIRLPLLICPRNQFTARGKHSAFSTKQSRVSSGTLESQCGPLRSAISLARYFASPGLSAPRGQRRSTSPSPIRLVISNLLGSGTSKMNSLIRLSRCIEFLLGS